MKFTAFGEIMLRLKPPGHERLLQSPLLEATFGGGEANVAIGLAQFDLDVYYVSIIPRNLVGDACIRELSKYGVDTKYTLRKGERLGIYFLEGGSNQRPSSVLYDRAYSAISEVKIGDIDWKSIFEEASWFHITGITPALSPSAADVSLEAVRTAKDLGVTVSCDLNYRKKLWKYGKGAPEVMRELMQYVDVAVGNEEDIQKALDIPIDVDVEKGEIDPAQYESVTSAVLDNFSNLKLIAVTIRTSHSADYNSWRAVLNNRDDFITSRRYEIRNIVDRVGSGDAFAAGFLYGLTNLPGDREALEFAAAAGCLKHTIPGDFPLLKIEEVKNLASGRGTGRIQR